MPAACIVPDCNRPRVANGLCSAHRSRRRRGVPLDTPLREYRANVGCSVPGCAQPHTARGLCHYHWRQDRPGTPQRRARTPAEIQAIRQLRAAGISTAEIARRFGCSVSTVGRIASGRTFRADGHSSLFPLKRVSGTQNRCDPGPAFGRRAIPSRSAEAREERTYANFLGFALRSVITK